MLCFSYYILFTFSFSFYVFFNQRRSSSRLVKTDEVTVSLQYNRVRYSLLHLDALTITLFNPMGGELREIN